MDKSCGARETAPITATKVARTSRTITLVLLLLMGAMSVAEAGDAVKQKRSTAGVRRVQAPYDSPAVGTQGLGGGFCSDRGTSDPFQGVGCVAFVARPTEFFIDVRVEDSSGLPVPGWVQTESTAVRFCGSTASPVPVEPGTESLVWVFASSGVGPPPCAGAATRGVVKAAFLKHL